MSKKRTDVVNRVALDLNAVGLGQGIESSVEADISARVDTILAELDKRLGLYIPDLDDIPNEVFETFCDYIEKRIGKGYGRPEAAPQELIAIEQRIKEILKGTPVRRTLSTTPELRRGARFGRPFNFTRGF